MKHSNLYYILLEDQQKNPMDPASREQMRVNLENFYREIKPPWQAPHHDTGENEIKK